MNRCVFRRLEDLRPSGRLRPRSKRHAPVAPTEFAHALMRLLYVRGVKAPRAWLALRRGGAQAHVVVETGQGTERVVFALIARLGTRGDLGAAWRPGILFGEKHRPNDEPMPVVIPLVEGWRSAGRMTTGKARDEVAEAVVAHFLEAQRAMGWQRDAVLGRLLSTAGPRAATDLIEACLDDRRLAHAVVEGWCELGKLRVGTAAANHLTIVQAACAALTPTRGVTALTLEARADLFQRAVYTWFGDVLPS